MIIHTMAEGIALARKLETDSAEFYEKLAKQNSADAEIFTTFAKENKKNISNFQQAYYGVITDAIEGCYALNLEADEFELDLDKASITDRAGAIKKAVEIEEKIQKFYAVSSEQSSALMADVPRTFSIIGRKRTARIEKLKSL